MAANIPSINSWQAIYSNLERAIMFGGLRSIKDKYGYDAFPLIAATFYSHHRRMIISPDMPCIVKISHAHAGMGKIKINDQTGFQDIATVVAVNDDYCSAESFIEPEYGIRVQKIGNNYRVMRKKFTGSGWKSQFGGAFLECIDLTPKYKWWADACSQLFGGMDVLAVDAIHGKNGKDYILELNGTAIGIMIEHWLEDSKHLVNMVVKRCNDEYF